MILALKVALVVFGVVEIVFGVLVGAFPENAASMAGVDTVSGYLKYTMASLGVTLAIAGVFIIIAAWNPLRHINWVKFSIVWCIFGALVGLAAVIEGYVEFGHAGMQIIMDAAFAVIFLALYPYKLARTAGSPKTTA
jgi:hypothetical protein